MACGPAAMGQFYSVILLQIDEHSRRNWHFQWITICIRPTLLRVFACRIVNECHSDEVWVSSAVCYCVCVWVCVDVWRCSKASPSRQLPTIALKLSLATIIQFTSPKRLAFISNNRNWIRNDLSEIDNDITAEQFARAKKYKNRVNGRKRSANNNQASREKQPKRRRKTWSEKPTIEWFLFCLSRERVKITN